MEHPPPSSEVHSDDESYCCLGSFHRPVRTTSVAAQRWFDRGLVWCYGFNHEEAVRCFERAAAHDPSCALAYWGLAYALGPNYNKPWELFGRRERQTAAERTHAAVERARAAASSDTSSNAPTAPVEVALIGALSHRYPSPTAPNKTNVSIWNASYAEHMAAVSARFPDDLDVAALYADALMNLTPWNLWDIHTGRPAAGARTLEARRVLEHAMALDGGFSHPGLLHLYIHLIEMSSEPETALPAANRLRGLVPDSGHLNHMPSHIDMLLGDYERAIASNTDAVIADNRFLARQGPMNFYTLYRCHDHHFRLYAAMFAGQSRVALETVAMIEASITEDLLRVESPPMADWLEAFLAMRIHALVRFGRWRDLLALDMPRDRDLYCATTALTHYGRGVALAATGHVAQAEQERRLFREAVPLVKPSRTIFNNRCVDILGVAEAMLDGEVLYRAGDIDAAFARLADAVARYDSLPFDEPWGWMQPARHAFGALLLEQGRPADALAVYSADLGLDDSLPRVHRHPNNVWALHGYHECLLRLGRDADALVIEPQLKAALALADVPVRSSCHCRTVLSKNDTSKI